MNHIRIAGNVLGTMFIALLLLGSLLGRDICLEILGELEHVVINHESPSKLG